MANTSAAENRVSGARVQLLTLALAAVAVLLVLSLASAEFQPTLNSDYLLAEVFSHGLGDAAHPVSGWKFGSSGFWFPDYLIYLPLHALCGNSGWSYPLYAVAIFLLLGTTMAWSLAEAGIERGQAVLAGFLALVVVLLAQFIPGHAPWLWELGIPAFHGGDLVNGFALLALTLGAVRAGTWSRGRSVAVVALMALGLVSNALLLFHWIIPLGIALAWQTARAQGPRTVLTGFAGKAAVALSLAVAMRVVLALAQWFLFYRLFRDWPLPTLIWNSLAQFFADFFHNGLFATQWVFWLLAATAIYVAVRQLRFREPTPAAAAPRVAFLTILGGLALAWITPMLAIYWHDVTSFRYLLNWLVTPAWLLALWVCLSPARVRLLPRAAMGLCAIGAVLAVPRIQPSRLVFPRPPDALALRDFCEKNGLSEGLSDYWTGHFLDVVWDFSGPTLGNVRDKDFTYFWCNNAFAYFPAATNGPGLRRPAPQFILLGGLDRDLLAQRLGGQPLRIEKVGSYEVALLSPEQTRKAGELITTEAEAALQGRRAAWLEAQLPLLPAKE